MMCLSLLKPLNGHLSGLEFMTKTRSIGRASVNAFGSASDLVFCDKLVIDFLGAAGCWEEHFAPGSVFISEDEMSRSAAPTAVRNDRYLVCSSQRINPAHFGQPATPVHIGLPDRGGFVMRQQFKAVPRRLMFAGRHASGTDLRL